jgi:glycosidase
VDFQLSVLNGIATARSRIPLAGVAAAWASFTRRWAMTISRTRTRGRNVIFLDNHDMTRFFSEIGEDAAGQKMGHGVAADGKRGIPQLYYGTEVLYEGHRQPRWRWSGWTFRAAGREMPKTLLQAPD